LREVWESMNERQQRFAQGKQAGQSNREAMEDAGYNHRTQGSADVAASQLCRSVKVGAYLAIIREQDRRLNNITKGGIVNELAALAELATGEGEFAAAKGCWQEVAKLLDMYPAQKLESTVTHEKGAGLRNLTPAQWEQILTATQEEDEQSATTH